MPARAAELSTLLVQTRSRCNKWVLGAMSLKWVRLMIATLERVAIRGIQLHYALRKLYLEEITREALTQGIRQVVVIGAGFDTLSLRLHEAYPAAQFIEIDHPATQKIKTCAVESHNLSKRNLRFLPLDLTRQGLAEALLPCRYYRPDEKALFIAEGLLMYLEPDEVDRLFRFIRGRSSPGSRFAITFMEPQSDGRVRFHRSSRAVDAWLRLRGESFKWGIRRERINEYLAARGFALQEVATPETLRSRYLVTERLARLTPAEGECICVASVI